MNEMTSNSFSPASWQQDFVNRYLEEPKSKSLLVAASGTGKTITALYAAKQMLERRIVDSTLVITDRLAIRDQWRSAARQFNIDLESSIERFLHPSDGISVNIQSLRSPKNRQLLEEIGRSRRWFVIVDDPGFEQASVSSVVDSLLSHNKESKSLFIARAVPPSLSFESEFRFNSEFILNRSIIELPETEIRVARFSPSFPLLRQLQRDTSRIDDLSWREFEKLIAALLEREGYEVELMQGSKDGGVDVVAIKDLGAAGYFKTLWQAKKKSIKNRVGISVIRELADTRQEFGASKGIIVTSTYLTRGALERIERDKYILGKVDRDDLDSWIKKTLFGQQYG
jgi:restriction system protein